MDSRVNKTIYFDNAATTFPKPALVYDVVDDYIRTIGVSAGRAAHRQAIAASRIMFDARERLAAIFGVRDAGRIVFTVNATESLNLALLGSVKPGDQIVVSSIEHNSVMRPLRFLQDERQVNVEIIPCSTHGAFDLSLWESALKKRPKNVVVNHGSNVIGSIAPLSAIGALCRKHDARFFVDAAQTAGIVPIDVEESNIDYLCFSGHKNLYGIQGTGVLYIREGCDPRPIAFGGTGSVPNPTNSRFSCPTGTKAGPRTCRESPLLLPGWRLWKKPGLQQFLIMAANLPEFFWMNCGLFHEYMFTDRKHP